MRRLLLVAVGIGILTASNLKADSLGDALAKLKAAGPNATGAAEAQAAWPTVAGAEAAQLPVLLAALDDAGPVAANWIRSAIDAVGERCLKEKQTHVAPLLETFVLDTAHAPQARRLAYDWLVRFDPTATDRLMAGFLNDPSTELRRDAVERLIAEAAATKDEAAAVKKYEQAFAAARDLDQIESLSKTLKEKGVEVDLPKHFGFIMNWQLIGPFDNLGGKGFDTAYPPETEIKLDAKYPGKDGVEVGWQPFTTTDPHGDVDLNTALGKNKGAAAYAYAEVDSDVERPVDIRIGSIVAIKVWVNGKLVDSRESYHSGTEIDQYVSHAVLHPGVNRILVKCCENEQTEQWAQDWKFQLRVCDAVGTAVLSQNDATK